MKIHDGVVAAAVAINFLQSTRSVSPIYPVLFANNAHAEQVLLCFENQGFYRLKSSANSTRLNRRMDLAEHVADKPSNVNTKTN